MKQEDGREEAHPTDECKFFREDYYLTLSYRKRSGRSGDAEPGYPNTPAEDAEEIPKRRLELNTYGQRKRRERAAHIHIVVNGINNISHIIRDLWEKGWISIKPLDKSGQYRKLAGYFIKYSDKTMKTEQGFINKRYCSSRNLHIPEPEKTSDPGTECIQP